MLASILHVDPVTGAKYRDFMASVSVIIPFFNVERYIERCIHSLLNQTLDNIELIFVDDDSTDRSLSILKRELAKNNLSRFMSVIVLSNDEKLGVSESRRRGVAAATGEFIGWVDADDWTEFDAFEKMYKLAIRDQADIVVSNSIWHYTDRVKYMDWD